LTHKNGSRLLNVPDRERGSLVYSPPFQTNGSIKGEIIVKA
jgi:hypothetical protein